MKINSTNIQGGRRDRGFDGEPGNVCAVGDPGSNGNHGDPGKHRDPCTNPPSGAAGAAVR